jgi:hypothetical protein
MGDRQRPAPLAHTMYTFSARWSQLVCADQNDGIRLTQEGVNQDLGGGIEYNAEVNSRLACDAVRLQADSENQKTSLFDY